MPKTLKLSDRYDLEIVESKVNLDVSTNSTEPGGVEKKEAHA